MAAVAASPTTATSRRASSRWPATSASARSSDAGDSRVHDSVETDHGADRGRPRTLHAHRFAPTAHGVARLARVNRDAGVARPLDRLGIQHLRPGLGHLLQARQVHLGQMHGLRNDARIRRVDAVDVAVDLAVRRPERRGERHRGRVAAAAPESRDLAPCAHALVARDDDDLAARELLLDANRSHLENAGVEMAVARDDAALRAGEADGLRAARMNGDRQERHGDAFARRHEHVELAARRVDGDPLRQREKLVGRLPHRADDDDDVVACALGGDDSVGDDANLLHVGHGRTAVFLD